MDSVFCYPSREIGMVKAQIAHNFKPSCTLVFDAAQKEDKNYVAAMLVLIVEEGPKCHQVPGNNQFSGSNELRARTS
ncbi:hypothetical protein CEXT_395501 [Caerostris extrusa]|uniref:Uncharacterized protein n=1 Tax=Caerostris extrusa TaxID=172846 RepID=A0AAV4XG19_CAEEX|nr:hypothetical protein CEXT_395501 [Caerostris extrusa]